MLRVRLRETYTDRVVVNDASVDLVAAVSSVSFRHRRFAWDLSYRRPTRVHGERGSKPIRDHVMLARLAAVTVVLLLAIRRSIRE